MKQTRVYVDTSVFGGCFDVEFQRYSKLFFEQVRNGNFKIVVSETVIAELVNAPEQVKEVFYLLPQENVEVIPVTDEIKTLRDAYIRAGVLGKSSMEDAEHIAAASIAKVDVLISWNFKHIVNFAKIKGYHAINLLNGYGIISIHKPEEVLNYDS